MNEWWSGMLKNTLITCDVIHEHLFIKLAFNFSELKVTIIRTVNGRRIIVGRHWN